MTRLDEPRQVRGEDAFDVAAMHEWLSAQVDGLDGVPEVRQFSGGASNLTYLLHYPDRDLILRRPPAGTKAKSAHDMGREHLIQSQLKPVFDYVPDMLALCADETVIGSEFYVMQRLPGVILRRDLPPDVTLRPADANLLCRNVLDRLVDLHSVDPSAAGLDSIGKGDGYVGRQVSGWSDRYRKARTWNVPSFGYVMDWLADNQPADAKSCVIHNDYRFDNVVLDLAKPYDDPAAITGILDWEMATIGDPLMDLGGALAYWMQADDTSPVAKALRMQPTHRPGMLTRREVVDYYSDRMGLPVGNWAFYSAFGLFRLAVIAQQIYFRYHHKQTRNPKFRHYWIMVNWLHWRARQVIAGKVV